VRSGLDDPVPAHLPGLTDTAAAGSEMITVAHLLRMTAGNGFRWQDEDADHPGRVTVLSRAHGTTADTALASHAPSAELDPTQAPPRTGLSERVPWSWASSSLMALRS
jgi:CubicO group peptidase (beta-lactamase class C family)